MLLVPLTKVEMGLEVENGINGSRQPCVCLGFETKLVCGKATVDYLDAGSKPGVPNPGSQSSYFFRASRNRASAAAFFWGLTRQMTRGRVLELDRR